MDGFFQKFQDATVLVIGDVMIDCYLRGKANRISPEAPVPIMEVTQREYRLGGAANVALNLQSLGAKPILCTVIGDDGKGNIFYSLADENRFDKTGIVVERGRKTTIKYRIIGNNAQMLRVDDEDIDDIKQDTADTLFNRIQHIVDTQKIDAIIFEDYDKGLLNKNIIQRIVQFAQNKHIFTSVDPKKKNFNHYHGVTFFKPNLKELSDGLNIFDHKKALENIQPLMQDFSTTHHIDYVMTTLSENGIAIYDRNKGKFYQQPAFTRSINDVSGAGDTVISIATLCLIQQQSIEDIALLSNLGGGLVCEYLGVVPISSAMLYGEFIKRSDKHNI